MAAVAATRSQKLGGYHIRCQVHPVADESRFLPDSDAHRPTLADDTPRWTHTGNDIIGALWNRVQLAFNNGFLKHRETWSTFCQEHHRLHFHTTESQAPAGFVWNLSGEAFLDPEDGEALDMRLLGGPPPHLASWLALDGLQLHGHPLEPDRRYAPQLLVLVARDREGLGDRLVISVDLRRPDAKPCHPASPPRCAAAWPGGSAGASWWSSC
ncbi:unnamed protein product [Arctogadus glacialis]